jgi:hypothetical protein
MRYLGHLGLAEELFQGIELTLIEQRKDLADTPPNNVFSNSVSNAPRVSDCG